MPGPTPNPNTQLTGSLGGVQKALQDLGGTITNNLLSPTQVLNREFGTLGEAMKALGLALGTVAIALTGPTAAIATFGEALGGLVAKANPVVFQQFTMAMNDLMAVIGRALVPLFETVVIPVIRMAADSLMELAPAGAALAAALQPLVGLIGESFAVAVGILAEAIKLISPVIMAFARVLNDVVRFVGNSVRELLALIGVTLPEFGGKPGASVGAATRQAGHSGIDDVVKQAQRAAFSLGNAQNDPMGKIADATKDIKARADAIYEFIQKIPQLVGAYIEALPEKIARALKAPNFLFGGAGAFGNVGSRIAGQAQELKPVPQQGGFERLVDDAMRFGEGVRQTWVGRQIAKPGVFGFTSPNPF